MAFRKTIISGDNLWSLAHRYLGSGTRYREIIKAHNNEAARFQPNSDLIPITDPNLIYIGQTIIIPSRTTRPQHGQTKRPQDRTAKRHEANQTATGLRTRVDCEIADDNKTWHYKTTTPDYTIEAKMIAKIGIENLSRDRYQYNFDLLVSKNKIEVGQKLSDFHSKAFKDLTDGVKMTYESGQVTIKAPIATNANVGPYTFDVSADTPNHFSGSVKFEPLNGVVENKKRKFAYTADVQFIVDVTLHPTPKTVPEPVEVPSQQKAPFKKKSNIQIDWAQVAKNTEDFLVKLTITVIGTLAFQARMAASIGTTTSTMPMMYRIDINDPRLRSHNPGAI